jgi:hypothetical protein
MSIIQELQPLLKRIDQRLASIERQLAGCRPLAEVVSHDQYSCNEVAELTQTHGIQAYQPYTIRLAGNEGRVPDATKLDSGGWHIPRMAVIRILEEGIPPQRRKGST